MFRLAVLVVLALAGHALLSTPAEAQHRRPSSSSTRRLTPEEIAEHDAWLAALQARCAQIGREACLEEQRQQSEQHLRGVTRSNIAVVLGAVAIGSILLAWSSRRRRARAPLPRLTAADLEPVEPGDLVLVELAIPGEDASSIRRELDSILSAHPDPRDALAAITQVLRRARWTHVGLRQWPRTDASTAHERRRTLQAELAARATLEVPPDPGRGYRGEAAPREDEHALVSLVVLSRAELHEHAGAAAEAARATLASLEQSVVSELISVDVSWYPPGLGEVTTTRDLLARAPRLGAARA